ELLRQVEGLRGTRLFAEPAEYAPQHVDFVDGRVPLAGRVRILRVVFRRNHRNSVGRAGNLTQFAAETHFEPIFVSPQLLVAAAITVMALAGQAKGTSWQPIHILRPLS